MKFVDEATLTVQAGKGGDGSASFRREKYIPFGGPDGGDGGRGGHVRMMAKSGLNTLADFRYIRQVKAENGEIGRKKQCTGRNGHDKVLWVPAGTLIRDLQTQCVMADLVEPGDSHVVAQGGKGGLGNVHYKSSTNRAPRKFTKGAPGEFKTLKLELKLLADVGLLGLPNAGKSSLIRAMSAAKPKVADYPFTTLVPQLGVVRVGEHQSFVMADIPGLIEGASQGQGLGIRFLKHLSRTCLLLHVVDIGPLQSPVQAIQLVNQELHAYGKALGHKAQWLVFNKIDLYSSTEYQAQIEKILIGLNWQGPWFAISTLSKQGIEKMSQAIMRHLAQEQESQRTLAISEEELRPDLQGLDA